MTRDPDQRGQALLVTLATMAFLSPLAAFALHQARLELMVQRQARQAIELFHTADAGLEHALGELAADPTFERLDTGSAAAKPFPFRFEPPQSFPRAGIRYAVAVEKRSSTSVDLVARARSDSGAVQAVAATVLRDPRPLVVAALASMAPALRLELSGSFHVSGADAAAQDTARPAVSIGSRDGATQVASTIPASCAANLDGSSRVSAGATYDVAAQAQAIARDPGARALPPDLGGSIPSGLVYRDGSLRLTDASGAGVLVVLGDLRVYGTLAWQGVVLVLGDVLFEPGSDVEISGAVVQGPLGQRTSLRGSGAIRYDSTVLQQLDSAHSGLLPHGTILAGWRDLFN